jgi:hypothetical protein
MDYPACMFWDRFGNHVAEAWIWQNRHLARTGEYESDKDGLPYLVFVPVYLSFKTSIPCTSTTTHPQVERHDAFPYSSSRRSCVCIAQGRTRSLPGSAPRRQRLHHVAIWMCAGSHRSYRSSRQSWTGSLAAHASSRWRQCLQHLHGVDGYLQIGDLHLVWVL